MQPKEKSCNRVGYRSVTPVTPSGRCASAFAWLPLATCITEAMERPNLVRQRFLAELESWLTPSLLYHCFTGEDDPYRLAHIEKLEPALQEPLLKKAEQLWPQRLAHIAALRKTEQQSSKAMVKSYVQSTLVGADTEPIT